MPSLFLALLCALLCFGSSDSLQENIETLTDNVLVLRVPNIQGSLVSVPLTCGDAYQSQPVFWKKNGMDFTPPLQGNQVKVEVEEMKGGNYTCHLGSPDGEYLNHTEIFVQLEPDNRKVILEEKSPEQGHIHCSAHNHEGSFHCTWTRSQIRSKAAVLLVKAERFTETIPCVLDADGSGVRCQDTNCSHKEEQHRIFLTVYLHSFSRLEAYKKTFYLWEIVKPEKLPNLNINDDKVFSWDYPASWSKPCTYFSLQFQVKVVHKGHPCDSKDYIVLDIVDKPKYEVNLKTNRYVFCVRAQDKFTKGPWSHWSECTVNKNDVSC